MEIETVSINDDGSQTLSVPSPVQTEPGASDKDASRDDDDVSLPESVNSEIENDMTSCCKQQCATKFQKEEIQTYKMQWEEGNPDRKQIQDRKFECLKQMFQKNDEESQKKGIQWSFKDQKVCRRFWQTVHSMSSSKVDKWLKLCRNGQLTLPKPSPRAPKPEPTTDRVGLWFLDVYCNVAEPLAVEGSEDRMPSYSEPKMVQQHETVDDTSHPLMSLSFLAGAGRNEERIAGKRFVNCSTLLEFYRFYKADVGEAMAVSRSTFDRCYGRSWHKFLVLRSPSGGNKCTICLRLEEERCNASTETERLEIDMQKQAHLDITKKDRAVNTRGNIKGSELANFQPSTRHQGLSR